MAVTVYQLLQEDPDLVGALVLEQLKILIPVCVAMVGLGLFCGFQLAPPLSDFDGRAAVIFSDGKVLAICVIIALGIALGIFRICYGAIDLVCAPIMLLMFIFYLGPADFAHGANRLLLTTSSNQTARQYVHCTDLFHTNRHYRSRGSRGRSYISVYTIDAKNCAQLKWQLTEPQTLGGNSFRNSFENREIIARLPVS